MRAFQMSGCCVIIGLTVIACSQTTHGTPTAAKDMGPSRTAAAAAPPNETAGAPAPRSGTPATPDGAPDGLLPGEISTLLLSDEDVSAAIGMPMQRIGSWQQPADAITLPARNECKQVILSDEDRWTSSFTAYRSTRWLDNPDATDFLVTQEVATYPNHTAATRVFQQTFNTGLIRQCSTGTIPDFLDGKIQWRVDSLTVTDTAATLTFSELVEDHANGWRCSSDVRVTRNVMATNVACQFGNSTTVTRQLADTTANRVGN